jgi:hypothetical protein
MTAANADSIGKTLFLMGFFGGQPAIISEGRTMGVLNCTPHFCQ